jgi:hypothetical protein
VPEKLYFPPRLIIVILGTVFSFAAALGWIFGNQAWRNIAVSDPRKAFAHEVFFTVSASIPFVPKNGSGNHSANGSGRNSIRQDESHRPLSAPEDEPSDLK